MFSGFLQSVGNSRTPLVFLIISGLINIVLDVVLIIYIPLGVAGAAYATIIAQLSAGILCGVYIWRNYKEYLPRKNHFHVTKELLKRMLTTGFSVAFMLCIFSIGSVILQSAINALGDAIIAAHTAARRIIDMRIQPLSTIATATSTFVAQNWGAGNIKRIKATLKKIFAIEVIVALMGTILIFLGGRIFVKLMIGTDDETILTNADRKSVV